MSDLIRLDELTYTYPGAARPALREVSLAVREGEFVVLSGPSGSGKSTLLRAFNGLVPHFSGGRISGRVSVAGLDPVRAGPSAMSRIVGVVFQDPEAQFVVDRVEDEVAFALENAALPRDEMRQRVDAALTQLEIAHLRGQPIARLSGGEQQRVAIASALALRPRVLVLDEPTSQLDDDLAEEVLTAVARLNRELGLTIVLSEHRLARVLPFAQRVLWLDDGVLAEARHLEADAPARRAQAAPPALEPRLEVEDLHVSYGRRDVLHGLSLTVRAGEVVALTGRSGSGKSTLLKAVVGLIQPSAGRIRVNDRDIAGRDTAEICRDAAYLPQNPNALLFADTVRDELNITRRNHGLPALAPAEAAQALARLGIAAHAERYPRDLSVGERQRAALGAVTAAGPALLLLDEPTRGLDAESKRALAAVVRDFAAAGAGVLLVTHDRLLINLCADRDVQVRDLERPGRCAPHSFPPAES